MTNWFETAHAFFDRGVMVTIIALLFYGSAVAFFHLAIVSEGYETDDGFFYGVVSRVNVRVGDAG